MRRSGGRIRLSLRLTDVVARRINWAESYDCALADGFDVSDQVVAEVLKALDVRLASGEQWLLHRSFKQLNALEIFYRGLSAMYAGTREGNSAARELFAELARLQPDSPIGPAYLSFTHWADAFKCWAASRQWALSEAARWAEKATALGEPNGLPEIVLASRHLIERRHEAALALCHEAVRRRPNCPTANGCLAQILLYCGHAAEAVAKIRDAMRISPVYPAWYVSLLAAAYRDLGETALAVEAASRAVALAPGDRDAQLVRCSACELAGYHREAQAAGMEVLGFEPTFTVEQYVGALPYRDGERLAQLAASLRRAGMPG
jgi:tetratricopeptide (TPR) repeat protein